MKTKVFPMNPASPLGGHIFTNGKLQKIALFSTITVGLFTIAYFYHEIKRSKREATKNILEIEKLQHEISRIKSQKRAA